MLRKVFALFFLLVIVGCTPATIDDATPTVETNSADTVTTEVVVRPTPTETPPGSWAFFDPQDPSLPEPIVPAGGSYHLDPNWQVASVEYLYRWWGLSPTPGFDYHLIERNGDAFEQGAATVDAAQVQAFLAALTDLYPTTAILAGNSHTDDYPSWTVEITGVSGERLQLFSSSTGNPGSGPWNVLYNGRLYAQYSGAIAEPLADLFSLQSGSPAAHFDPSGDEPGEVNFGTQGRPAQLTEGFAGLLLIADAFQYSADGETAAIQGYMQGRSSIGGFGNMVIGTITSLKSIELTLPDDSIVSCSIEEIPTDDPSGAQWEFNCPIGRSSMTERYRYPIRVQIESADNVEMETEGVLFGTWQKDTVMVLPPSAEVEAAFADHEAIRELLETHTLFITTYTASLRADEPQAGTLVGEAVLLGQTSVNGMMVRYTVATPFAIENGLVTTWTLSQAAVDGMLAEIDVLPLTHRIVSAVPDVILNLWYAEKGDLPEVSNFLTNFYSRRYEFVVATCGRIHGQRFPLTDKPLRAFGFNSSWWFSQPDFVLVDGKALVGDLDLWPARDDRNGVLDLLIPVTFDTGDNRPFERIWIQNDPFSGRSPALTLWIPEDAEPAELELYNQIADSLPVPVPVDKSYETLWQASDITFVVTEEGTLDVLGCRR